MLKSLDQYRRKVYVSPRVMQQALNYINTAISHAHSWKLIKPHMLQIIQDIVFPLMSYSESDAELWDTDPYDYIRIKFDIFEDFVSPVTAAQTLLHSACKKRKEMLQKTMNLLLSIIQTNGTTPHRRTLGNGIREGHARDLVTDAAVLGSGLLLRAHRPRSIRPQQRSQRGSDLRVRRARVRPRVVRGT